MLWTRSGGAVGRISSPVRAGLIGTPPSNGIIPTPGITYAINTMNENSLAMTEGVKEFLSDLGLEQYYDVFITKGYDSETDIQNLQERDMDSLNISHPGHRQLLLTAARHHTLSDEHKVYEWLRQEQLDYYFVNFVRSELTDFNEIVKINLPDLDLYDELEILLPGHRKRLERAVRLLRKRRRLDDSAEEPLVTGRWGKPPALEEAKYDFLCVQATIMSTNNAENCRKMEFMVDSGSDVVTLREEILNSLDLELLGPICSKGVHASRQKLLYKAKLFIGPQEIEIEVMPETYDSLGSRVLRHFRHFINGERHVWLRGNYTEPTVTSHRTTTSTPPHHISTSLEPQSTTSSAFNPPTSPFQQAPFSAATPIPTALSEMEQQSTLTFQPIVPSTSPVGTISPSTTSSTDKSQGSSSPEHHNASSSTPAPSTSSDLAHASTSTLFPPKSCQIMPPSTVPYMISPSTTMQATTSSTEPEHHLQLPLTRSPQVPCLSTSETQSLPYTDTTFVAVESHIPPSFQSLEPSSVATFDVITSLNSIQEFNVSQEQDAPMVTESESERSAAPVYRGVESSALASPRSSSVYIYEETTGEASEQTIDEEKELDGT